MDQPEGDADSRAMEEGKGKELEHAASSEVEQQATATAASTSTERGNLVDLAVKFLNNPRVQGSPMDQKRAFLKKKGLTDAEIDKAIQLAKASVPVPMATNPLSTQVTAAIPPPLPVRPPPPPPRSRRWQDYALMTLVVGGVGYVVVQFVRRYVIPWLEGPKVQERKLDDIHASVQELQNSVTTTVASLNESTQAIRGLLSEHQQHLELLKTQVSVLQGNLPSQQSLREVKEEVGSLKGLLLSRHQFPPTPTRQPNIGIPSWQRAQSSPSPSAPNQSQNQKPPPQPIPNGVENGGSSDGLTLPSGSTENPQDWHDAAEAPNAN